MALYTKADIRNVTDYINEYHKDKLKNFLPKLLTPKFKLLAKEVLGISSGWNIKCIHKTSYGDSIIKDFVKRWGKEFLFEGDVWDNFSGNFADMEHDIDYDKLDYMIEHNLNNRMFSGSGKRPTIQSTFSVELTNGVFYNLDRQISLDGKNFQYPSEILTEYVHNMSMEEFFEFLNTSVLTTNFPKFFKDSVDSWLSIVDKQIKMSKVMDRYQPDDLRKDLEIYQTIVDNKDNLKVVGKEIWAGDFRFGWLSTKYINGIRIYASAKGFSGNLHLVTREYLYKFSEEIFE